MTGSEKKGLVIAEDHTLIREGLRLLLSSHADLEVIGEAADGREAIQLAEKLSPALVLMDLSMPRMGGVEATRVIKKKWPHIKVLALTGQRLRRIRPGRSASGGRRVYLEGFQPFRIDSGHPKCLGREPGAQPEYLGEGDRGLPGREKGRVPPHPLGNPDFKGAGNLKVDRGRK